ncbi:type VI secretion system tube protein TssD [Capnocytophaga canis]|uniref:type VI secretion system tube protein TssD n=1 Tax=Capnocytophaga canis TaxID=1848903 RepID=UPI00156273FA|nr:type VI secretion system tube protein TssD [Capnocytophaga canis]
MKGILNFKGIERTLISFRLPHRRRIDTSGYPCSLPRDSFFYVSFLAEEGDDFFMQWMCGKNIAHGGAKGFWHDGEIVFYDETSDGQEFYRYDLQYVMPIHFRLEYDHQNGMVIHLTLTALDRVYNHLLHTENFYGYFFEYAKPKEKPKPMPKEKPDILEIYYTDEKGNRIDKGVIGQDIYLIIRGENLKGEETDLDLSDDEIDFEYQGERLVNDVLKGYIFENDKQEKIPLKVVAPKN